MLSRKLFRVVSLVLLISAAALGGPLAAQFQAGDLYGTITDEAGAPLPDVKVTLICPGVRYEGRSDEKGLVRFGELAADLADPALLEQGAGAGQGGAQAPPVDGLEQVVDGVHLEGADGVGVVGGDEDNGRHLLRPDLLDDGEAVALWHVDIQDDEVGGQPPDGGDRLGDVAAVGHHPHLGLAAQQVAQALPRERLVVDDDRAELHPLVVPSRERCQIRARGMPPRRMHRSLNL